MNHEGPKRSEPTVDEVYKELCIVRDEIAKLASENSVAKSTLDEINKLSVALRTGTATPSEVLGAVLEINRQSIEDPSDKTTTPKHKIN